MNKLLGLGRFEQSVRKSRFVAVCGPIEDAGEPSGTAGRPILAAIDQLELDFTIVVVNRYFGGVKLGTGGLARAFSSTAIQTLEHAVEQSGWQPIIAMATLKISAGFDFEAILYRLIEQHQGQRLATEYDTNGLIVRLSLPSDQIKAFSSVLADQSRGQATMASIAE